MIVGRFVEPFGRPFIQARLELPRLGISSPVDFLFDTGADVTLLMADDVAGLRVDASRLSGEGRSVGVGGLSQTFSEPALLAFTGSDGRLYGYRLTLRIAPPGSEIGGLPSLLGRDITDRWSIRYAPRLSLLEADVLDADGVMPPADPGPP